MKKPSEFTRLSSKEDFRELMLAILNPLKPFYTKECSGIDIGPNFALYGREAMRMEAFSRPLWGLVPFWAGGGNDRDFEEIYHKGLANGTNPNSEGYWGECGSFDQRFVEMAAIAYGIMYAPEKVWDPLSEEEKKNLAGYLYKINEHPLPVCNWVFFAVLVNIALKSKNMPYSAELTERYLDGFEQFYQGDGWYCDGDSNQKDYYISFAIHFYSLIYADREGKDDPVRAQKYKDRAMEFAKQFIYWFDETGEALPFGRSLTYRFAQVSFFSACLLCGLEPFPVPVMKGLIVRHLKNWFSRPIFDKEGLLTVGYGYPNIMMSERYNAPGSPYWAMKTFAFLLLPDDHEFFRCEPAALPKLEPLEPMPKADMLVYHYGNHTTAFAAGVYSRWGHGHIVPKYSKFAYDTRCSISVSKSEYELCENAPDSMLAFFINGYVYVRRISLKSSIEKDRVVSEWSPYSGITVVSEIIPNENGHVRKHTVTSSVPCEAYDCGFSVNRGDYEDVSYSDRKEDHSAVCSNSTVTCKVSSENGKGEIIYSDPNLNLLYTKTAIPAVKYDITEGTAVIETRVELNVL